MANIEKLVEDKDRLLGRIYSSRQTREWMLEFFQGKSAEAKVLTADAALVLGTSRKLFEDKFLKRVFWGTQLLLKTKVQFLIFSGMNDLESRDENQAEEAKKVAVEIFGAPAERIYTVGGTNTQENFAACRNLLTSKGGPKVETLFVVSEEFHLIRAMQSAREQLVPHSILPIANAVGQPEPLDANDPLVKMELIRALAYNRTLVRGKFSDQERERLKNGVDSLVNRYYEELGPMIKNRQELPFEEWKKKLT